MAELVYGAAALGNMYAAMADEDADAILQTAWGGGIRSYDTAPHYGLGLSERRLGRFLQSQPRESFRLSTKVGRLLTPNPGVKTGRDPDIFDVPDDFVRTWDPSREGVRRSLDQSLDRLGLDRVDTVYLHDPDVYDLKEGIRSGIPALQELKAEGVIDRLGVGVNSVDAALEVIRSTDIDELMIAGRYTLIDRSAGDELLPLCIEKGVRVAVAAVFNSGLLASSDRSKTHYDYGPVPQHMRDRLERVDAVCARHGVPVIAAAIQFPGRHPAATSIVFGSARPAQITANLEAASLEVSAAFWRDLETALAA